MKQHASTIVQRVVQEGSSTVYFVVFALASIPWLKSLQALEQEIQTNQSEGSLMETKLRIVTVRFLEPVELTSRDGLVNVKWGEDPHCRECELHGFVYTKTRIPLEEGIHYKLVDEEGQKEFEINEMTKHGEDEDVHKVYRYVAITNTVTWKRLLHFWEKKSGILAREK
jgi:hypothetical protein